MDNDSRFIVSLNQAQYYFKVTLYNGDSKSSPVELTYTYIHELSIEETIFIWNTGGYIILKNEYELFERGSSDTPPLYTFRNDGRNKINIRIFPVLSDFSNSAINPTESLYPEQWELNYDFVVYAIDDIPGDNLSQKKKKLYFWDERYQHFIERNIQWSTYYVAAEQQNATGPLTDSTCYTGDAIKHLIKTACGETNLNTANSIPLKVGWSKDNKDGITSPDLSVAVFDDKNWDRGHITNKIFYTSPAGYNVMDDLTYLLHYYVSGEDTKEHQSIGMPGLLQLDRYTKQWSLIGIDKLYAKCTNGNTAGEDVIEWMYVQMPSETNFANIVRKTPAKSQANKFTQSISAGPASTILTYKFINMAGTDDLLFNNRPSINYNNNTCTWNIFYKDNTAENVKETIKKEILPKIYGDTAVSGTLVGINKDKINGLNSTPIHTIVQGDFVSVLPRNEMIFNTILLNQAIEFTAVGLTIRTPGKFFIIDSENSVSIKGNAFEDRFIGQWLIAKTVHNFSADTYLTNTIGVKINSFSELSTFKT